MEKSTNITLQLFASGYCTADAHIINPISGKGKAKFYAVWALLHLPKVGYVMFDTGYSQAFQKATQPFPQRLYRWATPTYLQEEDTAKAILAKMGILPTDIKYVIISHFHADHIAGLKDFANAQFICSKDSLEEVQRLKGFAALRKGILHALLPTHFHNQVIPIEVMADRTFTSEEGLEVYELFQQTHFKLVLLKGHAKGMLGFIFDYQDQQIFFGTDASWSYETYSQNILPKKVVKLFFDSWADFVHTQASIRAFEKNNPQFHVLFTHCEKTLPYLTSPTI